MAYYTPRYTRLYPTSIILQLLQDGRTVTFMPRWHYVAEIETAQDPP